MYGKKIKQIRKQAGLSQAELADRVGVSRPNISFWENAEYPPLEAIDRVCQVAGMDLWKFFVEESDLAGIINLPGEFLPLLERIKNLDRKGREDLAEIFSLIADKFIADNGRDTKRIPEEGLILPKTPSVSFPAQMKETVYIPQSDDFLPNHFARNATGIVLEAYMNRFLWINPFIH